MMNLPLNFSAPAGQVQNTYAQPASTNPYLTSSQYSDMQLHTPSGYYYQGGKMYEPYNPTERVYTPPARTGFMYSHGPQMYSTQGTFSGGPVEGSIQSNNQYFRPFMGNAQGIINGDLSMASMAGQGLQYQPQGIPNNLFNFLSAPNMQQPNNTQSSGAGRFAGLLGSPIVTTNTQGK